GRIGDETIAPTRKRADFHLVTRRKTGLSIAPGGDDVIFSPLGVLRLPFGSGGCSSMAERKLPKRATRSR
ncbi:MAG: hypothetical protein WC657_07480, partial [Candidatus Paceibacterota bacterium]